MHHHTTNKNVVLVIILLLIPLSGFGVDIYTPSLPALSIYFHSKQSLVGLTIACYLLGFSLGQLIVGPLSDSMGRKKTLLLGLALFSLFSFLITMSGSIFMLLFLRTMQGLMVTAAVVISKAITTDVYHDDDLKKVSIYLVTAWSVGPIVAPAIGGYLSQHCGWKGGFYFLSIYALIMLVSSWMLLQETNRYKRKFKLVTILNNYKKILNEKKFVRNTICLGLGYSMIIIFNVIGPFLIQNRLNFTVIEFGHMAMLMGFGCFLGSILNRFLIYKVEQKKIICNSLLMALGSSIILWLFSLSNIFNIYTLLLPTFLILLSVGFTYPNYSSKCLKMFPEMAGTASALMGVLTIIITSAFAGIASYTGTKTTMSLAIIDIVLCALFFVSGTDVTFFRKQKLLHHGRS